MKAQITEKDFIDKLMVIEKYVLRFCLKEREGLKIDDRGHFRFELGEYYINLIDAYNVGNRFITLKGNNHEIWINTVRYKKEFVVFDRKRGSLTYFIHENNNDIDIFLLEVYKKILFPNEPAFISMKIEEF
jgi:hypothetical protein